MEFAASCRPFRKSKISAVTIKPIRTGMLNARSIGQRPLQVIDDERVDLVRDVLQTVDDFLEMIVDLGADRELHRAAAVLAICQEQRLASLIVQFVGALLDAHDLLGQRVESGCVLADVAQQRHRAVHQLRGSQRILAHLLHLRLETAHLEQRDDLRGLVHLVDGVVERADQVLDVGAVERRDEGPAHRDKNLPGDLIGLIFEREDLLTAILDLLAAIQQAAQSLRAGDHQARVLLKQLKELVLLGHYCLEPAEHGCFAPGIGLREPSSTPNAESLARVQSSTWYASPVRASLPKGVTWENPENAARCMLDRTENLATLVENWLAQFEQALTQPDIGLLKTLFHSDGYWRDVLALTWDIKTVNGADAIVTALKAHADAGVANFRIDPDRTAPRRVTRAGTAAIEAIYRFETARGRGSGVLRLTTDDGGAKAWTALTALNEIKGHEEQVGKSRPKGESYSRDFRGPNWLDQRKSAAAYAERDPAVLVVGGGQAGLSIAE